jgi:hypothetical protein
MDTAVTKTDYITHKYQYLRHLQLHFDDIWPHYEFGRIYRGIGFETFRFTVRNEDVGYIEEYRQGITEKIFIYLFWREKKWDHCKILIDFFFLLH